MFRLISVTNPYNQRLWVLQEWESTENPKGRWVSITKRLTPESMDKLLKRMDCPEDEYREFRATVRRI